MTEEEITTLAKQIYRNEVFTSLSIRKEDVHLVPSIFMPVALMSQEERQKMIDREVAVFYAPMSEANERGINGYPCFFGMSMLTKPEALILTDKLRAISAAMDTLT